MPVRTVAPARHHARMRRTVVPLQVAPPVVAPGSVVHALGGRTMGTTWSVRVVADAAGPPPTLQQDIQRCLDEVVAQMSTWRSDSDLSRFNRAPPGTWQALPEDCVQVLAAALQVARDSGGAFDPSAGPLVDLWGFGPPRHHGDAGFRVPDADETAQARARTGWQRLLLDVPARRARQPGGMAIDLSAIAKGFAVDKLARLLTARGIANHLVEVGGELRGAGGKPDGQPWWVALEAPPPGRPGGAVATDTVVALHGLAVATSGDYRRCFAHDGQRLCHSIDPRSGRPIAHGLASVTVLHQACMLADAQSTALTVLGLDHGLAHAQQHRIAALFVQRTVDGVEEHMSDAFAALL